MAVSAIDSSGHRTQAHTQTLPFRSIDKALINKCTIPPGGALPLSLYQLTSRHMILLWLATDIVVRWRATERNAKTAYDDLTWLDVQGSGRPPNSFAHICFLFKCLCRLNCLCRHH
ncbi:hypothetical protein AVEN_255821-1 [Araneus ventricosus]|uniref:Uncharacterized protein n=1 Tax=Araneus ventricosus TaxID=182803 RepID=A0A4Y2VS14_ARAVE|nr:hypothetical protein AVEN_221796-1 [Araneus ventricosus]GBO26547.1 hypothetical protein AVEN_255821-1 [Araneus ventricosus]